MERHSYQIEIRWDSERRGIMCSPELTAFQSEKGCIEIATPPEFPKGIPGIWSPEHLFTASVSSCFMTTFLAIAENSVLHFIAFACKATGILEKIEGKFQMSEIILEPVVTISEAKDKDKALRVLQKTENSCLITNSIKSTVVMNPTINVAVDVTASNNNPSVTQTL